MPLQARNLQSNGVGADVDRGKGGHVEASQFTWQNGGSSLTFRATTFGDYAAEVARAAAWEGFTSRFLGLGSCSPPAESAAGLAERDVASTATARRDFDPVTLRSTASKDEWGRSSSLLAAFC